MFVNIPVLSTLGLFVIKTKNSGDSDAAWEKIVEYSCLLIASGHVITFGGKNQGHSFLQSGSCWSSQILIITSQLHCRWIKLKVPLPCKLTPVSENSDLLCKILLELTQRRSDSLPIMHHFTYPAGNRYETVFHREKRPCSVLDFYFNFYVINRCFRTTFLES